MYATILSSACACYEGFWYNAQQHELLESVLTLNNDFGER